LEGKLETQFETARKMRQKGFSESEIQEITGLSEDELKEHGIF
jgi:predicted transposase/invertase (TIGR01784 family)